MAWDNEVDTNLSTPDTPDSIRFCCKSFSNKTDNTWSRKEKRDSLGTSTL
jgi:hypothetical protein